MVDITFIVEIQFYDADPRTIKFPIHDYQSSVKTVEKIRDTYLLAGGDLFTHVTDNICTGKTLREGSRYYFRHFKSVN